MYAQFTTEQAATDWEQKVHDYLSQDPKYAAGCDRWDYVVKHQSKDFWVVTIPKTARELGAVDFDQITDGYEAIENRDGWRPDVEII